MTMNQAEGLPVFIVGAQRSGTTLVRLLLNAHPKLGIPEEARFLMPLLNRRRVRKGFAGGDLVKLVDYLRASDDYALWNYDSEPFLQWLAAQPHVGLQEFVDGLYGSWATAEHKPFWGDKSLFFRRIDMLAELFPTATFIHVVRDGRDVFDSWRKMDRSKNDAATIALDWRCKLAIIDRSFRALPARRTHTLRYEDLIVSPEESLRAICTVIGLEYDPAMLEFHRRSHRYIGDHHSALIFGPVDASNREKWRQLLTARELQAFDVVAGAALQRHGYALSGPGVDLWPRLSVCGRLLDGVPRRAAQVIRDRSKRRRALRSGSSPEGITVGALPRDRA